MDWLFAEFLSKRTEYNIAFCPKRVCIDCTWLIGTYNMISMPEGHTILQVVKASSSEGTLADCGTCGRTWQHQCPPGLNEMLVSRPRNLLVAVGSIFHQIKIMVRVYLTSVLGSCPHILLYRDWEGHSSLVCGDTTVQMRSCWVVRRQRSEQLSEKRKMWTHSSGYRLHTLAQYCHCSPSLIHTHAECAHETHVYRYCLKLHTQSKAFLFLWAGRDWLSSWFPAQWGLSRSLHLHLFLQVELSCSTMSFTSDSQCAHGDVTSSLPLSQSMRALYFYELLLPLF